jgi:hypothetical protein
VDAKHLSLEHGNSSPALNVHLRGRPSFTLNYLRGMQGLCASAGRQLITMSLGEAKQPTSPGTSEYIPLASHTLVQRTRREVRAELERLKSRRSVLLRTLLPSLFFAGIGVLIMFHPEFESSCVYKLAVLYHWALAVFIPWLVVRTEKKRIRRQFL